MWTDDYRALLPDEPLLPGDLSYLTEHGAPDTILGCVVVSDRTANLVNQQYPPYPNWQRWRVTHTVLRCRKGHRRWTPDDLGTSALGEAISRAAEHTRLYDDHVALQAELHALLTGLRTLVGVHGSASSKQA